MLVGEGDGGGAHIQKEEVGGDEFCLSENFLNPIFSASIQKTQCSASPGCFDLTFRKKETQMFKYNNGAH